MERTKNFNDMKDRDRTLVLSVFFTKLNVTTVPVEFM